MRVSEHLINLCFAEHEIERQKTILNSSEQVPQETRGFDQDRWETFKLRSKEDAPDYRYMPDPNLGILIIDQVGLVFIL